MSDSMVGSESDSENECLAAIEKKLKTVKETTANSDQTKQKQRIQNNVLSEQTQNVARTSDESDDDMPLANLRAMTNNNIANDPDLQNALPNIENTWESTDLETENIDYTFKDNLEEPPADANIESPYNYFRKIITEQMLANLENETNLYVLQKDGTEFNTTKKESEIRIGIYIKMGLVSIPRVRSYWEMTTRYSVIADKMSRNRFEKLASSLHVKNNLLVTEQEKKDKLWKIRPWLSALRDQFLKIPAE